ncbi:Neurotransmitter-gated ion-channel ligand binding domain protein [Ancylostoma caninum]|uniref:Neurotransmitter-gated ion-channel ligand binding domain protein n=1 Tax=Ancylostoma caninum TaxID=29170 RepID=A0A368H6E7_ANCCA|nr:Neurotransmitter-gated ion-channel ligand binding domain protein [Ancylostoma caninum]
MRSFPLVVVVVCCFLSSAVVQGNQDAKRLYDDLMNTYNRHKRPASGPHEPITIKLKLRLSQIIDVKVSVLKRERPTLFRFPFDEQQCHLKFGSWTYSENLLNLELLDDDVRYEEEVNERGILDNITIAEDGIDLSDYYPSVEWDIMSRVAIRRSKNYPSCCKQSAYVDITYYLNLRRKPLFYTVNLVFPCVGISFLTILVFYLPSHSGEKITLCISILVALTIFYLLLKEIIPATSITLPLIGKYLLFTMILVTLSVIVTVVSLNLHFRTPMTHIMPRWVQLVFLKWLPKMLFMRRQLDEEEESFRRVNSRKAFEPFSLDGKIPLNYHEHRVSRDQAFDDRIQKLYYSPQPPAWKILLPDHQGFGYTICFSVLQASVALLASSGALETYPMPCVCSPMRGVIRNQASFHYVPVHNS